ncbi:hypothetical protein [Amycolatopsis sp. lyj-108]|uniref:hypothetical protein n=1 Tax=Amycolatopsis sp. lyj-108 TaxID=2789286 RepID=UPI0039783ED4
MDFFHLCEECDLFDEYSTALTDDSPTRPLCYNCARDHGYYECIDCDTLISYGSYCDAHVARAGYDELHEYSYKPEPVFHGIGPRYLGMELEINVPLGDISDRAADAIAALDGLGYLKEDGSISHGFELVTHPMSYQWALESFPWELLPVLQGKGCTGDGVGMHVHISRDAFAGPCHVYRWMKFIYRNASAVQVLARRDSDYAEFDSLERSMVKETCKGERVARRSLAINTQPEATLELRVFASSLDPGQVKAALAFADASVSYTRDLTVADITRRGAWTWDSFTQWLLTHQQYSPLTHDLEGLACAC